MADARQLPIYDHFHLSRMVTLKTRKTVKQDMIVYESLHLRVQYVFINNYARLLLNWRSI